MGLDTGSAMVQRVCHISLDQPDSVTTIDSTPAHICDKAVACVIGDTVYAVGIGKTCNELWKWNAASDWKRCQDMTLGRKGHGVAVVNYTLYALGGVDVDGKSLRSVEAYNTRTSKWSAAAHLPHVVSNMACIEYETAIILFGGRDEAEDALDEVVEYNTTSKPPRAAL